MNVNSLPDELLASIFKYSDYESITGMRKLDSRIDRIAKRYGINKVAVSNAKVYLSSERSYVQFSNSSRKEVREFRVSKGKELEEICAILAKTKIKETFSLKVWQNIELGDNWIDMFCKQRHSFKTFWLHNFDYKADYRCTRSCMTNFVKMCSKMRKITFRGSPSQYDILNSEVLGSRNWDVLDLDLRGERGTTVKVMDSQFLNNVVWKCNTFYMRVELVFEIQDIINTITINLLDNRFDRQKWFFGHVSAGKFTLKEIVRRMIYLDGIRIQLRPLGDSGVICKITIPSKPKVSIDFSLQGDNAEEITEVIEMTKQRRN